MADLTYDDALTYVNELASGIRRTAQNEIKDPKTRAALDDQAASVDDVLAFLETKKRLHKAGRGSAPNPAVAEQAQCQAETYSWNHFNSEQTDGYWIRCTLSGTHDDHQDEHTGLTWTATASSAGSVW